MPHFALYGAFAKKFSRSCTASLAEYFVFASSKERDGEVYWALGRPTCMAKLQGEVEEITPDAPDVFFRVQTSLERNHNLKYIKLDPSGTGAYSLMQNPGDEDDAEHPQMSRNDVLHCLISNLGLVWCQARRCWLGPTGALLAQGYPMRPVITDGRMVASFQVPRPAGMGPRQRGAILSQMGNGMHVHECGIFLFYALTQTASSVPSVLAALARLRQHRRTID